MTNNSGHWHPVNADGAVDWRCAYSSERPAKQVSALARTPEGADWNGGAFGESLYCELAYPDGAQACDGAAAS